MTILALRLSRHANGVSKLHGEVSRSLWKDVWSGVPMHEVPITSITNGVHTKTWMAPEFAALYRKHLGDWEEHLAEPDFWRGVIDIPDAQLWETHQQLKRRLIDFVRDRERQRRERLGESPESINSFDVPIDNMTTGSLEALKAYSTGNDIWNKKGGAAAVPYFRRAVDLDPNFAMAYARIGTICGNLGEGRLAADALRKAFERQSRVSEWERFYISSHYYAFATRELEKETQTYEQWKQAYPRETAWRINLGVDYAISGQYERAISEELKAVRQVPTVSPPYANLAQYYIALNRFDEARSVLQDAQAQELDDLSLRLDSYELAFLQDDLSGLQQQLTAVAGKSGMEDTLLSAHADTAAFHGQVQKSRELSERAFESARRAGAIETAAYWLVKNAVWESEFGNRFTVQELTRRALAAHTGSDVQTLAALALARAGDGSRAKALSASLQKLFPLDTLLNHYWLPTIQSAIYLNQHKPDQAIEVLQSTLVYETGAVLPFQCMYPTFLRGQSYLARRNGEAAASEFRKILNHRGIVGNCPLSSLAHLELARSLALMDDLPGSSIAYQDFLASWKDADSDVPILKQAKAEYARSQ